MAAAREARQNGAAAEAGPDVKRFERPDRRLVFEQGSLEAIKVGGRMIGKGSYGPAGSGRVRPAAAGCRRTSASSCRAAPRRASAQAARPICCRETAST